MASRVKLSLELCEHHSEASPSLLNSIDIWVCLKYSLYFEVSGGFEGTVDKHWMAVPSVK